MNSVASDSVLYVRALRHLQALCRYTKYLPASCYLREPVTLLNQGPIHQSAFSDVYRGRLGAVDVAVKAIRIRLDNRVKVEKVSNSLDALTVLVLMSSRRITTKSSSGDGFGIRTLCLSLVLLTSSISRS